MVRQLSRLCEVVRQHSHQTCFPPGASTDAPGTLTAAHRSAVCPCAKQMGHAMGCLHLAVVWLLNPQFLHLF